LYNFEIRSRRAIELSDNENLAGGSSGRVGS
jgi:hypothetical protein